MCRRLARKEGTFGGGSTGLTVVAASVLAPEPDPGHHEVAMGCDSGVTVLAGATYP